jgi:hypothetical protein
MASGHVNRIKRPNTWLHRPMLQNREESSCQTGAVHIWAQSGDQADCRFTVLIQGTMWPVRFIPPGAGSVVPALEISLRWDDTVPRAALHAICLERPYQMARHI